MSSSSQQTWTEWILNSFANVVQPNPTEQSQETDGNEDSDSSQHGSTSPPGSQLRTSSSSSSPYGPYVRTGRGGAGNFTWQTSQQPEVQSPDLEAQKPSTLSERRRVASNIERIDTAAAIRDKNQRSSSQYIRIGRGGAGNTPFVQSNEIQQSPRSPSFGLGASISPASPRLVVPGRGGAGNFASAAELKAKAEAEKEKKELEEQERRRGQIEEGVSDSLPPPPDAHLGGRRRSWAVPRPDS